MRFLIGFLMLYCVSAFGQRTVLYDSSDSTLLQTNLFKSNILAGANVTITKGAKGVLSIASSGGGGSGGTNFDGIYVTNKLFGTNYTYAITTNNVPTAIVSREILTNVLNATSSGESNVNGEVSITNATRIGWVYGKAGITNLVRSSQGGNGITLTNQGTNVMFALTTDPSTYQPANALLSNLVNNPYTSYTNIGAFQATNANLTSWALYSTNVILNTATNSVFVDAGANIAVLTNISGGKITFTVSATTTNIVTTNFDGVYITNKIFGTNYTYSVTTNNVTTSIVSREILTNLLAGYQGASALLSNLVGLADNTYTNVLKGGTNISVRTTGGTNFIDTTGHLNNWSQIPTGAMANVVSTDFLTNWANAVSNYVTAATNSASVTNWINSRQPANAVLSNLVGLADTTFTNVPLGGTNISVRTTAGTNFIDTKGQLNNWALYTTNMVNSSATNAATNAVTIAAGSNITVTTNGNSTNFTYTIASTASGGFAALEVQTNGTRVGLVTNINWQNGVTGNVSASTANLGIALNTNVLQPATANLTNWSNVGTSNLLWTNVNNVIQLVGGSNNTVFAKSTDSDNTSAIALHVDTTNFWSTPSGAGPHLFSCDNKGTNVMYVSPEGGVEIGRNLVSIWAPDNQDCFAAWHDAAKGESTNSIFVVGNGQSTIFNSSRLLYQAQALMFGQLDLKTFNANFPTSQAIVHTTNGDSKMEARRFVFDATNLTSYAEIAAGKDIQSNLVLRLPTNGMNGAGSGILWFTNVSGTTNQANVIADGSASQVLTMSGGKPTWAAGGSGISVASSFGSAVDTNGLVVTPWAYPVNPNKLVVGLLGDSFSETTNTDWVKPFTAAQPWTNLTIFNGALSGKGMLYATNYFVTNLANRIWLATTNSGSNVVVMCAFGVNDVRSTLNTLFDDFTNGVSTLITWCHSSNWLVMGFSIPAACGDQFPNQYERRTMQFNDWLEHSAQFDLFAQVAERLGSLCDTNTSSDGLHPTNPLGYRKYAAAVADGLSYRRDPSLSDLPDDDRYWFRQVGTNYQWWFRSSSLNITNPQMVASLDAAGLLTASNFAGLKIPGSGTNLSVDANGAFILSTITGSGGQPANAVLSNLTGLADNTYTNVLKGGTNISVRNAAGTNFIDTTGFLNQWAAFGTNVKIDVFSGVYSNLLGTNCTSFGGLTTNAFQAQGQSNSQLALVKLVAGTNSAGDLFRIQQASLVTNIFVNSNGLMNLNNGLAISGGAVSNKFWRCTNSTTGEGEWAVPIGGLNITSNDYALNTLYTNTTAANAFVTENFTLTATLTELAKVVLKVDQANDGVYEDSFPIQTGSGVAMADIYPLYAWLNTNASFYFTNQSVGAATAAIVSGTGRLITGFGGGGVITVNTNGTLLGTAGTVNWTTGVTGYVSGTTINLGTSGGGGGSDTPWTTTHNAANYSLTNLYQTWHTANSNNVGGSAGVWASSASCASNIVMWYSPAHYLWECTFTPATNLVVFTNTWFNGNSGSVFMHVHATAQSTGNVGWRASTMVEMSFHGNAGGTPTADLHTLTVNDRGGNFQTPAWASGTGNFTLKLDSGNTNVCYLTVSIDVYRTGTNVVFNDP